MIKAANIVLILVLFLSGCEMKSVLLTPSVPLVEEGEIFVYLQPFPLQSERLRFTIEGIWALKDDGSKQQLPLSLTELSLPVVKRQRLFAAGRLSPGSYRGFEVRAGKAIIRRDDGEANLLVPQEPVVIEFPFTVNRKKALLVTMSLQYDTVMSSGFRFSPALTPAIPEKPLLDLTGYVTNRDSNTITVFDRRSGQAAAVIATGSGPAAISLDQNAKRAYVALSGEDEIDVIDVLNSEIVNRLRLNTGDQPVDVELTPDRRTLLTVNSGSNTVSFVDTFSLVEVNRVTVGNKPRSLVIDRTGRKAFVFNTESNSISVIDLQRRTVLVNISTEPGPLRGQFNRQGNRLYVYYENNPAVVFFDTVSFSVVKRLLVGREISSLKVDTSNDFIYIGKAYDRVLEVYDPSSVLPIDIIRTGGGVGFTTIDGDGNNLVMVLPQEKRLVIVNKVSKNILSDIDVGDDATEVVVMREK